jgi:hypothetical protein
VVELARSPRPRSAHAPSQAGPRPGVSSVRRGHGTTCGSTSEIRRSDLSRVERDDSGTGARRLPLDPGRLSRESGRRFKTWSSSGVARATRCGLLPHRSRLRNGLQTHGLPRGRRALTVAGVIHVLAGTHLRVTGTIRPTARLFQNNSPPSQIAVVGGRQSPTRRTRRPSLLRVAGLAGAGASTVARWRGRPDRAGT